MIFMYVMGNQSVINAVIKDYFDIIGITITTLVSIYDLFIVKFIEIRTSKQVKGSQTYVRIM